MGLAANLFKSSLGKKYLMAVSGLALYGFVVTHLLGNLQIFLGPDAINDYAKMLRGMPAALWLARLFLVAMAGLHIWAAVRLALENRAARPVPYVKKDFVRASYASRTMVWSGVIVAAYVVYHILHFTVGVAQPSIFHLKDPAGRYDIYSMMVLGFQNPWVSGVYVFSLFLLCLHMSHGFSSLFQSLGLNNGKSLPVLGRLGQVLAWSIFAGYASIPAAVLLGLVRLPPWR
jgi:succinate dehydrogenase / fumarate reductase, cytochrome b subunit